MTIDHDAIAARVRQDRETGTPGPWRVHNCERYGDRCKTFFQEVWNDETDILVTTEVTRAHNDGGTANIRRIAALPDLEAAYLDLYDEAKRLRAERDRLRTQCCMCGKTGLSTIEDGGPECELDDGRWVCSVDCYDRAVLNPLEAEAERDALRVALIDHNDLLRSAMQICSRAIQHEEFRVLANWDAFHDRISVCLKRHHATSNDARAALKGDTK